MQILRLLISCFSLLLTCRMISTKANRTKYCVIPYMSDICYGSSRNRFTCWMNYISHPAYINCRNSQNYFAFQSNNLLLLYPPFLEMFLNHSSFVHNLTLQIQFYNEQILYDIDLRSLNRIEIPFNLTLYTWIHADPIEILFRTYKWNKRSFSNIYSNDSHGFLSTWQILPEKNSLENIVCYHFLTESNYSMNYSFRIDYTCPSDQCSNNRNNQRICLGLTPCLNMGNDILLCQIDRLRVNDRFNSKDQFLYTDLVITTSNMDKRTLHRFSTYLWHSCIAVRLIIIILHGQLEIPSLKLTSMNCSSGLIMEIEFWHGNCSTFELRDSNDNHHLEQFYRTHFILFGNFYTGQLDRLNLTCFQTPLSTKSIRISDIIIACLLVIVLIAMCIVACSQRRKFIQ